MKMMGEIFNEISNPWLNIFNQNLFFLKFIITSNLYLFFDMTDHNMSHV